MSIGLVVPMLPCPCVGPRAAPCIPVFAARRYA